MDVREANASVWSARVYLTYLDDGGKDAVKLFGGIILHEEWFGLLESMSGSIAVALVPEEKRAEYEFHTSDLFAGTGLFEGIDEELRHKAIRTLLGMPRLLRAPYVYSAVDMTKLQRGPVKSASWLDAAFHMCACGVDDTIGAMMMADVEKSIELKDVPNVRVGHRSYLNLMILDDPERQEDRNRIRKSFRLMRRRIAQAMQPSSENPGQFNWSHRLSHSVDDLFFGSSKDSVGLQMADACNWVMWRRLKDNIQDPFYAELAQGTIMCAKPEPDWTQYRHLYRAHDES